MKRKLLEKPKKTFDVERELEYLGLILIWRYKTSSRFHQDSQVSLLDQLIALKTYFFFGIKRF